MKKFGLAFAVGVLMLLAAPSAMAQTDGYPGPTTTQAPQPTSEQKVEGTLTPGGTIIFESCGFVPNSVVTLTLNGTAIGTDTVEGDGCARQTVTLASTSAGRAVIAAIGAPTLLAQQGSASVVIDGRTFAARVGSNTLVVSGTGANGAPRSVTHTFTIAGAAAGGARGLARTGGMIARWTLAGGVLVAIGAGVVVLNRRRQQTV